MKGTLVIVMAIQGVLCVLGAGFTVDTSDVRLNEMASNIVDMKGAIMGIAEYMQQISKNVHLMQREVRQLQETLTPDAPRKTRVDISVDEILRREDLAQKIEKLFRNDNGTKVDIVKDELATVIETNFLKMLSALLITGPVQAQEKTPGILRLMKTVLNGQMDFKPVVERLPFLLRDTETNQFILLLKTLRDSERVTGNYRQLGNIGKVIDAAGGFDLKEVSTFLKEIPELFEGVESVVEGVEEYFKK